MISGWLVKIVVGIAVVGFLAVELGSPLVGKAQAQDAADAIATEAGFRLRDTFTEQALQEACATEADKQSVEIVEGGCTYDRASEEVVVTVHKSARSFVLKNLAPTKNWYEIEATSRTKIPSA